MPADANTLSNAHQSARGTARARGAGAAPPALPPILPAIQRRLPVPAALEMLVSGLQRGWVVSVAGSATDPEGTAGSSGANRPPVSTSLALALAAACSKSGSWCAWVGLDDLGLAAASGFGVDLDRFVLVPRPGADTLDVVAALLGSMELVLLEPHLLSVTSLRRLKPRAKSGGSVLIVVGLGLPGPGATGTIGSGQEVFDLRLSAVTGHATGHATGWSGLGRGCGRLAARLVEVSAEGRAVRGTARSVLLWLPSEDGTAARAEEVPEDLFPEHLQ
ncbi:MAG: hypothetical protein ACYDH5_07125 [Acidimicrobiales bacterium]